MATWRYYRTAEDRRIVAEEILSFGLDARGLDKWSKLLTAINDGVAQLGYDYKILKGEDNKGLREAILKYNGNEYRLVYSVEDDEGPILLGVRAFPKKSNKTPSDHLKTARNRRKDWRTRHAR